MIETVSEADCLSLKDNRKGSRKLEKNLFALRETKKEQQENYSAVNIT